jgi:hypothetical protein
MTTELIFPANFETTKYKWVHYYFFIEYAKAAKVNVKFVDETSKVYIGGSNVPYFSCLINNTQIIVDFKDHTNKVCIDSYNLPYFKFQSKEHQRADGIIPLGPPIIGMHFDDARALPDVYFKLQQQFNFSPGNLICNKQLAYRRAFERRNTVQAMLTKHFKDRIDIAGRGAQEQFWKIHENCLAAVCVPGATNNMVDRGQMELIGLGVCTVSPELYTVFPWHQKLEPGKHYIKCNDDYSDLVDILKELDRNKDYAKKIGDNAKQFFNNYFSPEKYWQWILENIEENNKND